MTNPQVQELAEKYFPDVMVELGRVATVISKQLDREKCAAAIREAHEFGRTQGPQWVSVSERLPETDGKYLCWHDDEMPVISFFTAQSFYNDGEPQDVTHWMPLPKPPVE